MKRYRKVFGAVSSRSMPVHPNAFGQKWNIQVIVERVIRKLIKGNFLEFRR